MTTKIKFDFLFKFQRCLRAGLIRKIVMNVDINEAGVSKIVSGFLNTYGYVIFLIHDFTIFYCSKPDAIVFILIIPLVKNFNLLLFSKKCEKY